MPSKCIIYALSDPRTGEVRYIGQSSRGLKQPKRHMTPYSLARNENPHKNNWLRQLKALGLRATIEIVEELPSEENLDDTEIFYIAYFRSLGFRLTNMSEGGGGVRGCKPSPETRAKLSVASKGRVCSYEERIVNSVAHGGCEPFQDETGRIYHTYVEAAETLRVRGPNIWKCLQGIYSQTGGHCFAYVGPDAEHKIKQDKSNAIKRPVSRPFHDETGKTYVTLREAADALGLCEGNIFSCLNGLYKSTGGHFFSYVGPGSQEKIDRDRANAKSKLFRDETGKVFRTHREAATYWGIDGADVGRCLQGHRPHVGGHFFAYVGPGSQEKIDKDKEMFNKRFFKDESGNVYSSQKAAADALGVDSTDISRHLNGKRSHVGGHTLTYLSPPDQTCK